MKKVSSIVILSIWAVLTLLCWFSPEEAFSDAERRPLAQRPQLQADSLLSGRFMAEFEKYAQDQFPLREGFRTLKALFHTRILGHSDNNGIYVAQGSAAVREYPLDEQSVAHALSRFNHLYEKYLTDSRVYMALVPDKGIYLAENSPYLALDYREMARLLEEGMPWATHIDLLDTLSADDYYPTDTHWQQQKLFPAAQAICEAMGVSAPDPADYRESWQEVPFHGVYRGQSALPLPADKICLLHSPLLESCTVYDHESGKTLGIYDPEKLEGKDPYEVYLSGPRSLLTIENPMAATDRELIVFRDSFASPMIPLLLTDYAKITVVDIRYIQIDVLDRFLAFSGQDVLLLYSTLVLNNSQTIK